MRPVEWPSVFRVTADADGTLLRGEPVTLLGTGFGPDSIRERAVRGRYITSVDDLERSAQDIWPAETRGRKRPTLSVPEPTLLRRILSDAKASDVLGQHTQEPRQGLVGCVPSPLARIRTEDFDFFRDEEERLDALIAARGRGSTAGIGADFDASEQPAAGFHVGAPIVNGICDRCPPRQRPVTRHLTLAYVW